MARLRRGRAVDPGGHHRDRGRRRRAGGHGDGRSSTPSASALPSSISCAAVSGRGAAKSTCLLLYAQPLGETAKARLAIMRETEDGFRIAEEDLQLRGAGELLGTRQSGLPDMRLADLAAHAELLQAARDDARLVIERDPDLQSERGAALRALLYLFRRDDAVQDACGRVPIACTRVALHGCAYDQRAVQMAARPQIGILTRAATRSPRRRARFDGLLGLGPRLAIASRSVSCLSSVAR